MSDYLWNLAARALGGATVLRPRLAPLYGALEPAAVWPGAELAGNRSADTPGPRVPGTPHQASGTSTVEAPAPDAAAPVPSEGAPPSERKPLPYQPGPVESKPGWPGRRAHHDVQAEAQRPVLRNAVVGNAPATPQREMENPVPPPVPGREPRVATPFAARVQWPMLRSPEETISPLNRTEGPRPMSTGGAETAARDLTAPPYEKARPTKATKEPGSGASPAEPRRKTVHPAGERPPAIPGLAARAPFAFQPPAAFPAAREAAPESTPTIQVTIGRIELRATHPAERPRTAETKPASSSLQEYLKRRARGGGE